MNYDKDKIDKISAWLGSGSINIFGLPFAGKDTQAKRLAQAFGAPLIGGGDILRNSSEHARKLMSSGELFPMDEYLKIVLPYLGQKNFAGKPLILSAVGRWNGEQQNVLKAADQSGHPIKAVVMLNISDREVRTRWQTAQIEKDRGQRPDDGREAISTRLEEFRTKTQPVIEYYRQKGLLIEINGTAPRDQVTTEILEKLLQKAQK